MTAYNFSKGGMTAKGYVDCFAEEKGFWNQELACQAYVIDLTKYAPVYDEEFRKQFYLYGHMNASGYILTANMIDAYIDYIVRHNPEDFSRVGFIGTDLQ